MTDIEPLDYLTATADVALEDAHSGLQGMWATRLHTEAKDTAESFSAFLAGASTLKEYDDRREIVEAGLRERLEAQYDAVQVPGLVSVAMEHLDAQHRDAVASKEMQVAAGRLVDAEMAWANEVLGKQIEDDEHQTQVQAFLDRISGSVADQDREDGYIEGMCHALRGEVDPMPQDTSLAFKQAFSDGVASIKEIIDIGSSVVASQRRTAVVGPLDRSLMFTIMLEIPQFARLESRTGSAILSDMMEDWAYATDTGAVDMHDFVKSWVATHGLPPSADYPNGLAPASHMQASRLPLREAMGDGTSVEVATIPQCDIHAFDKGVSGVPAAYDGKTQLGPWANMCQACFDQYGTGLGVGRGQKLVLKTSGSRHVAVVPQGVEVTLNGKTYVSTGKPATTMNDGNHQQSGTLFSLKGDETVQRAINDSDLPEGTKTSAQGDMTPAEATARSKCQHCNVTMYRDATGTWNDLNGHRTGRDGHKHEIPERSKHHAGDDPMKADTQKWVDANKSKTFTLMQNGHEQPGGPWSLVGPARNGYVTVRSSQGFTMDVDKGNLKSTTGSMLQPMHPYHEMNDSRYRLSDEDVEEAKRQRKSLEQAGGPLHESKIAGSDEWKRGDHAYLYGNEEVEVDEITDDGKAVVRYLNGNDTKTVDPFYLTKDPSPVHGDDNALDHFMNGSLHEAEYHYIRERNGKYEIWQKGTGKTLSTHDTKEKAEAAFRAMMESKHGKYSARVRIPNLDATGPASSEHDVEVLDHFTNPAGDRKVHVRFEDGTEGQIPLEDVLGSDSKGHDFTGFQGSCRNCGMDKPEKGEWVPRCSDVQEGFGDHMGSVHTAAPVVFECKKCHERWSGYTPKACPNCGSPTTEHEITGSVRDHLALTASDGTWAIHTGSENVLSGEGSLEQALAIARDYAEIQPEPLAFAAIVSRASLMSPVGVNPAYAYHLVPQGLSIESAFFAPDAIAPSTTSDDSKPIYVDHTLRSNQRIQEANEDFSSRNQAAPVPMAPQPVKTPATTAALHLTYASLFQNVVTVKTAVNADAFGADRYQTISREFPEVGWAGHDGFDPNPTPVVNRNVEVQPQITGWPDSWTGGWYYDPKTASAASNSGEQYQAAFFTPEDMTDSQREVNPMDQTPPMSTRPQVSPAQSVPMSGGAEGTGDIGAGDPPTDSGQQMADPSTYEQPTIAQRMNARAARMARQIEADNPHIDGESALRIARLTIQRFPGMVKVEEA